MGFDCRGRQAPPEAQQHSRVKRRIDLNSAVARPRGRKSAACTLKNRAAAILMVDSWMRLQIGSGRGTMKASVRRHCRACMLGCIV